MLSLTNDDIIAVDRALCSRSLSNFIAEAWHVLEPAHQYIHGWHIDAVCDHLEAITNKQLNRLLINIPPGTMKSLIVNVFWPAWEWGPKNMPSMRYIGASHELSLAVRDSTKMRRLIESDWYQARWPIQLQDDQNSKTNFETAQTGFRVASPVSSMTGKRGDRVLWDDPLSAVGASSDTVLDSIINIFKETLPTRLTNPEESAIVIIMQRLHQRDPSGYILENKLGYTHLMLPMEYDPKRHCTTKIGFSDPRTEKGELLFPERFPREVVERDKNVMGDYAVAGQLQQTPIPRGGKMFPVEQFKIIDVIDRSQIVRSIRYWDKAGTEHKKTKTEKGAHTAGVLMHKLLNGRFVVEHVVRGQWEALAREKRIKSAAELDGEQVHIWVEQEPGSGGKDSAQSTIRNLAGFVIHAERPTGDKVFRADPYSAQVQAGNVDLLRGDWNQKFIDEHEYFPNGSTKDQVDAASGAFNKLNKGQTLPQGAHFGTGELTTTAVEFNHAQIEEHQSMSMTVLTKADW